MSKKITPALRRLVAQCATRRGSMLIMVIVILVLLALIGTAMISTSRIDRQGTAQHAANTQIDLFVQSVINIAEGSILADLYNGTLFRPPNDVNYHHWDSIGHNPSTVAFPNNQDDTFIAARTPSSTGITPAGAPFYWSKVTAPLLSGTFESPYVNGTPSQYTLDANPYGTPASAYPTITSLPIPIGGITNTYPAFLTGGNTFLAADADGDGIADSGLFRLPVGLLNGVAYYAAVRIIDNNSAINANTAWSGICDYDTAASPAFVTNQGYFASNVGLMELLSNYSGSSGPYTAMNAEMNRLNQYRFNTTAATAVATTTTGSAFYDPFTVTPAASSLPTALAADFKFSTQGEAVSTQLANRLNNPGYRTSTLPFQALSISESLSMASRFCLRSASASPSILESATYGIPSSVYTGNTNIQSSPYLASNINLWFAQNFNFSNPPVAPTLPPPLRALLTTRNGVSNTVPAHNMVQLGAYVTTPGTDTIPAYDTTATAVSKVSINTAAFNQLWQGFWNTMVATNAAPMAPAYVQSADLVTPAVDGRMFRELTRDPRPTTPTARATPAAMTSSETMMIRSAITAVNTLALRGNAKNDYTVPSRRVLIRDSSVPGLTSYKYEAMVYGGQPQPFISEVYANTNTALGPKGYVAVELYNPYDFAISLANWNLGVIYRPATTTTPTPPGLAYPQNQIFPITAFLGFGAPGAALTPIVPAKGWLVLDNFGTGGATALPLADVPARPATAVYVPNLNEVFSDPSVPTKPGGELVLLRPRRAIMNAAGTKLENDALTTSGDTRNKFDESTTVTAPTSANLADLVPVDQFDFTGMVESGVAPFVGIHYVRQSDAALYRFKQVYPGKYDPRAVAPAFRQEGVQTWDPTVATATTPPTLGLGDLTASYVNIFPPIELANVDFGGANKTAATGTNTFPFGGFARNGDMLQIPFMGAYRIRQVDPTTGNIPVAAASGEFLELNSVTMDATRVDDGELLDDADEMLGRFCPLDASSPGQYETALQIPAVAGAKVDYYSWASHLFDYFTVSVPNDDYLPNVDPGRSDSFTYGFSYTPAVAPVPSTFRYPQGQLAVVPPASPVTRAIPQAVKNSTSVTTASDSRTPSATEVLSPTEGLININTAPWYVMKALPFVATISPAQFPNRIDVAFTPGTAPYIAVAPAAAVINVSDNEEIAKIICAWRDGDPRYGYTKPGGPFTSIFDLNKVTLPTDATKNFANLFGIYTPATQLDDNDGDLSPINPSVGAPVVDGVLDGFEKRFNQMTRISNLISTRSDTFTVYVLVQGWRNIGTATPELVVQRRAALIVDRNGATPTVKAVTAVSVPTE